MRKWSRKPVIFLFVASMVLLLAAPVTAATNDEINKAIRDGLAWLAANQHPTTGQFPGSYQLANTATTVIAFENEGHFPGGSSAYSVQVEKALNFIFNYGRIIAINPQTYGYSGRNDNPDTNGNGKGIYFSNNSYMYETGIVMQAIVASNTPDRVVTTGPLSGMTYRDVMVDLVDFLGWAQIDGGSGRGSWRYDYYNNVPGPGDNSVSQWPVLGLLAAEQWGINAPAFVKNELNYWVTYIQNPTTGASGYDTINTYPNESKTGGLIVEFNYIGDDQTTARAQKAINFLNSNWNNPPSSVWYGNVGHPYAMYAIFKGLEMMKVATIPNAPATPETSAGDWWGHYCDYLVDSQIHPTPDQGYWEGYSSYWDRNLATPWYIIILQASVFPVSVDVVVPQTACDQNGYDVSVYYTVERFEANGTVKIYKDETLFDTITLENFKGTGLQTFNLPNDVAGSHSWEAVLDVTGNGITTQAMDSETGMVYSTPNVSGIPSQYAPFSSFDLDDFQTCDCADVDWTATGYPADWAVTIDANHVVTILAPVDAIEPANITFTAIFHWPGQDCVDSETVTFSPNRPPVADAGRDYGAGEFYEVLEGGTVQLDGSASFDPDGDALVSYDWDLNEDCIFETPGTIVTFSAAGLDKPPTNRLYVYLKVVDEHGAESIAQARINILDAAPTPEFAAAPVPQAEGSAIVFTDLSTSVVDSIVAWQWDFGGLGTSNERNPVFTFPDNGTYAVTLTVTDDDGSVAAVSHPVEVSNVPPELSLISTSTTLVQIGTAVTASASFTDPSILDTHAGTWTWDDGTSDGATVTETNGCGTISDAHAYTTPGVYTITLDLLDDDGGSDRAIYQYVVVYDPNSGFVTGGGWINSPAGAYAADPSLTGKANFGFVSKYKRGATVPTGNTEFNFKVANLNFHSDSYEWLVVSGPLAKFKGVGTINGISNYGFMITARDGQVAGGGGVDKFRIKIWEKATGTIVYDNQLSDADDADATCEIGSGSIVIHK